MGTDYSRLMEGMVDGLQARVKELEARLARAACYPASYQICAEHPDLTSPDKRLPCPACLEKARADKADTKAKAIVEAFWSAIAGSRLEDKEWPMDALNIWNEARGLRAERDAALAKVGRLRAAMPCPQKLWALAAWIDLKCPEDPCPEVQADLRDWAHRINAALLWPCGHENVHMTRCAGREQR